MNRQIATARRLVVSCAGVLSLISVGACSGGRTSKNLATRVDAGSAQGPSATALGLAAVNRARTDPSAIPEAIRLFETALRDDPHDGSAAFGLGWALQLKGDLDGAVRSYRRAVWLAGERGPKDIEFFTHYNLGTVYQQQDKREAALGEFALASAVDGSSWNSLYNLGLDFVSLGCAPCAVAPLTRAAKINGKEASIQYELGVALWKSGKRDTAETAFAEAARLEPKLAGPIDRFKTLAVAPPSEAPVARANDKRIRKRRIRSR